MKKRKSNKKKLRKAIVFFQLHPFNFPIALFLSFFVDIAFWRSWKLPTQFLKRFEFIDPEEYFTMDEWFLMWEKIYALWKDSTVSWNAKNSFVWNLSGLKVDLSKNYLQWLAIQFEMHCQFVYLIERWQNKRGDLEKYYVIETFLFHWHKKLGINISAPAFEVIGGFAWFDRLGHWLVSVGLVAKQIVCILKNFHIRKKLVKPIGFVWAGIGLDDVARGKGCKDFAFLSERGLIGVDENLFILTRKPGSEYEEKLTARRIGWVTEETNTVLLSRCRRARIVLSVFGIFFKALFFHRERLITPILLQIAVKAQVWVFIARELTPKVFLSSAGANWPELPQVAVMNALGVRTVCWFNSSNMFGFCNRGSSFKDVRLLNSIWVSREIWVWNAYCQELFEDRMCRHLFSPSVFRLVGPVMLGNSKLAESAPLDVRRQHKLSTDPRLIFLGVFDVPSVSQPTRCCAAIERNTYPAEMLDRFFEDIQEVLKRFDNVRIILKPKKALGDASRLFSRSMQRLLDFGKVDSTKIVILNYDADPYLAVALSDLCVGLPFTSPVVVGLRFGRGGIFHDPLSQIYRFKPVTNAPLITHGREELFSRIEEWLQKGKEHYFRKYVGDCSEKSLGPEGDPGLRFSLYLKNGS